MCNELSSNDLSNKKARKKSYNDDLQNDLMYSSLDLNNALFVKRKHFLHDNAIFTKKVSKHVIIKFKYKFRYTYIFNYKLQFSETDLQRSFLVTT